MSNSPTLPPFPVLLCETSLSMARMPRALASVEHEGTTWLLRAYEGLIFFKREADTQGDAIFVLTELLPDPTPKTAVKLWKKCFPLSDWARFGIRKWEGGYDWVYQDKMQHDLCFILAKETGQKPSGLRISTDLSFEDFFMGPPEEIIIEDEDFLSYLYTDFKAVSKVSGEKRENFLLNSPLENILEKFSTDKKQAWLISDIRYMEDGPRQKSSKKYKEAQQWLREMPDFFHEVRWVFSLWEGLSLLGNQDELEHLLRCACLVHSPSAGAGVNQLTICCKTPFLAAQPCSLRVDIKRTSGEQVVIPDSLKELCNLILGYFDPEGHSSEYDHEKSFGNFVPEKIQIEFSSPTSQQKREARMQLKAWLQDKAKQGAN